MYGESKNYEKAKEKEHKFPTPRGWIQWKGTDVCMDVYCICGVHGHIDADFTYHLKCAACKRVYLCNPNIQLIELDEEPNNCIEVFS